MPIREAIAEVRAAADARRRAEDRYQAALRAAIAAGVTQRELADVVLAGAGAPAGSYDPRVLHVRELDAMRAWPRRAPKRSAR